MQQNNKLPQTKAQSIAVEKFDSRFHPRDKSHGISARNKEKYQEKKQQKEISKKELFIALKRLEVAARESGIL